MFVRGMIFIVAYLGLLLNLHLVVCFFNGMCGEYLLYFLNSNNNNFVIRIVTIIIATMQQTYA